ncbi:hypothetical protein Btru_061660, partial [Bulinus truncatus]
MIRCKVFLQTVILFIVLDAVYGATCKNSTSCVATTYTSATCDATKNCTCTTDSKYTYIPIRSGCGRRLLTPVIETATGYTKEVLDGKDAELTCSSDIDATMFEWYFNGDKITGATDKIYTIKNASNSSGGKYSCKAKLTADSSGLDSEKSSNITIVYVPRKGNLTNDPRVVLKIQTNRTYSGETVDLSCTNLPNGYNMSKIAYKVDSVETASEVNMTASNSERPVNCILTDTEALFANKSSTDATKLPKVENTINKVEVTNPSSYTVYHTSTNVVLTCTSDPDPAYIDKSVTYLWQSGNKTLEGNYMTIDLPKEEGTYVIKCSVLYNSSVNFTSDSITILRNSSLLTKPVIYADPPTPVIGQRLVLTCGNKTSHATYTWANIARQFDDVIQLDNLTISDAGEYKCTVEKNGYYVTSDVFKIN